VALAGDRPVGYNGSVDRVTWTALGCLTGVACLLAGCLDMAPLSPADSSLPAPRRTHTAAPSATAAAPPVASTQATVELPKGFPLALPDAEWMSTRKLEAHVRCTPGCEPPPWSAQHPAPVALWTQDLESVPLRLERDGRIDVYGVVLRGRAVLVEHEYGTDYDLEPWQAFHAPGAGLSLTGGHPAPRLALAIVSDGEPVSALGASAPKTWALRPGKLAVVDLGAAEPFSWAGDRVAARLGFEQGRASFGLLSTTPEAPMPPHDHARSWEVIGLLSAEGELRTSSAPAQPTMPELDQRQPLRSGDVAAVRPGSHHGWAAAGGQPLFAVQLYVPPGPEQRFRALAGMP
jgi:quercetin dioxygenase-like cupin family protein